MKKLTTRMVVLAVVAAGACGLTAAAGAEDSVPAPAAPLSDAAKNGPIVMKAMKVGGVRSGEAVITGRGMERVLPPLTAGTHCLTYGQGG